MTRVASAITACALLVTASVSGADLSRQPTPVQRAFEHYERIRAALARDTTTTIAAEARALSPLARQIAGEPAGRAAASLAEATNLEQAREHFGTVSEALVPKFLEAAVPGVHGFVCSMKDTRWVQRGATPANPYFGKAMARCGTPIDNRDGR